MKFDLASLEADLKAAALPEIEHVVIKSIDVLLDNVAKQAAAQPSDGIASALAIAMPLLKGFLDPLMAKALPEAK